MATAATTGDGQRKPEEFIGDRGYTVKPDDTVRNEHLVSRVSAVGLVVRKVR